LAIVAAAETDTLMLNRRHSPALRALRTTYSESLENSEENVFAQFGDVAAVYFGGDLDAGIALTGAVAGRIDSVRPAAEIIATTVEEFAETLTRLSSTYLGGPADA